MAVYSRGCHCVSPRQQTVLLLRALTVSLSWVFQAVPADSVCGLNSLNAYGNQVLGELKRVFVVNVV